MSIGVYNEGGRAFLAAAFTNTERGDNFSRKASHSIIANRIINKVMSPTKNVKYTCVANSVLNSFQIMIKLRESFKLQKSWDRSEQWDAFVDEFETICAG
jgi:hypothetical protein